MRRAAVVASVVALGMAAGPALGQEGGGVGPEPSATPTPTPVPSETATPEPTATPVVPAFTATARRRPFPARRVRIKIEVTDIADGLELAGPLKKGLRTLGMVEYDAPAGESTLRIAEVAGKRLRRGRYKLTLYAIGGIRPQTVAFRVG